MSFEIPEQPVYLYDPDTGATYFFDGVIKIEHSIQLKIEDDPSNIKNAKAYTNNARNEPDEIKIEIAMSNVYVTTGDLPGKSGDRLKNAFSVLDGLKSACRLLSVVTTLKTYTKMLIKSLTVTQAEGNADGWNGEITLHQLLEPYKAPKARNNTSSEVDDGTDADRTPSLIAELKSKILAASSTSGRTGKTSSTESALKQ
ncbi:MAG: hypothetical protein IKE04_02825 [Oscillospiraceae bacterium]|nr:hypothetical protein [Oscillospiraceae bacterium]